MTIGVWRRATGYGHHGMGVIDVSAPTSVTLAFGSGATSYAANQTVNTFTGLTFLNPAAGRICAVTVALNSAWDVSTVTIDGVGATSRAGISGSNLEAGIWTAPVAAGTSLDVVVTLTFHDASTDIVVASYSLTGLSSAVPSSTGTEAYAPNASHTVAVTIPTGGAAIALAVTDRSPEIWSWSVGVEDYEPASQGASPIGASSAHLVTAGAQTFTAAMSGGADWGLMAAAAWGP